MKKLLLSLTLAFTALTLSANPVDYQTARTIAENFAIAQRVPAPDVISLVPEQMFSQLYVFGFRGQKGFVIVSADDRAIPVLGYSLTTEFRSDNMPDHISAWLHDYENQINWLIDNHVEPSAETLNRWSQLLNPANPNAPMAEIIVDSLVQTTWNQYDYYNNLCPVYSGQLTVTGCPATAAAQVMKYWNHPTSGHGSHSYVWKGETLSADFEHTTYEWNNMPDSLNQYSTQAQVNAVAKLMYHFGVAMNMQYGLLPGGSGGYTNSTPNNLPCAESALKNFFKYSNSLHSIRYWTMTDAQWKNTLKNELDNARPMLYSGAPVGGGAGHTFVCDGYDSQDNFHFNWGWGGKNDGFFAIGQLNPSATLTFNAKNAAIIGIAPINGSIPSQTVVTAAANDTAHGYVTGAGTYNQYDTIKLTAFAKNGYKFDHWDDYETVNPRYTPATSATYNHTAYFTLLPTDTIGYCEDESYNAVSAKYDTCHWGIRYPASVIRSGRVVDDVKLYSTNTGQYTLIIYQGDSVNMTQVYSENFNIYLTNRWVDLPLTTPCAIDTTRSLWITFRYVGTEKVASLSGNFTGNRDGMMWYENSAWRSLNDEQIYFTWMIRAILSDPASILTRYNVTGLASTANSGYVNPPSMRVLPNTVLPFTAIAADNHKLIGWTDGDLNHTRSVTVISDTTLTADFEPLRPDTTTYCMIDNFWTQITLSSGLQLYWAIKVKAGLYSNSDSIRSIMIYDNDSTNINLAIYAGDSISGTPLHTDSFTLTNSHKWVTLTLSKPVACPVDDDLWVAFTAPVGSKAASVTYYSANADGCYYSTDGTNWSSLASGNNYFTWMIKVITNHNDAPSAVDNVSESAVTLAPNPIHAGETAYIYGEWSDAELAGMQVEVLTIDGKTITRTTPQTFPIAIRGINAPGTYIIRIMTGTGEVQVKKLTVN